MTPLRSLTDDESRSPEEVAEDEDGRGAATPSTSDDTCKRPDCPFAVSVFREESELKDTHYSVCVFLGKPQIGNTRYGS